MVKKSKCYWPKNQAVEFLISLGISTLRHLHYWNLDRISDSELLGSSIGGGALIVVKAPVRIKTSSSIYDSVTVRIITSNVCSFIISCVHFSCLSLPYLYRDFFDSLSQVLTVSFPSLSYILCGEAPDAHHPTLEFDTQITRLHFSVARKSVKLNFRNAKFRRFELSSLLVTIPRIFIT